MKNSTVKETVNEFEDFYETIVSKRVNLSVLECLFDNFASLTYKHTESHKYISEKEEKIVSVLIKDLNEKQKKLFEQYEELITASLQDYGLQQFITGMILADTISSERSRFCNDNKFLNSVIEYIKKLDEMEK